MSNDESEPTMADVAHTHPYTGATFGHAYRRGPVATDGGEDAPQTTDGGSQAQSTESTMRGVEHTPADGTGAKRVWARGTFDSTDGDRGDRVNE